MRWGYLGIPALLYKRPPTCINGSFESEVKGRYMYTNLSQKLSQYTSAPQRQILRPPGMNAHSEKSIYDFK